MEAVTTSFRNRVKQDGRKMGRASWRYREGRAERGESRGESGLGLRP